VALSHLPEDDNHHSHRRGNLKSYMDENYLCNYFHDNFQTHENLEKMVTAQDDV
jgi:hypothetical protein